MSTSLRYHGQFKANQFHGLGCMAYGMVIENGEVRKNVMLNLAAVFSPTKQQQ